MKVFLMEDSHLLPVATVVTEHFHGGFLGPLSKMLAVQEKLQRSENYKVRCSARTYLQPHYSNGVFGIVYFSA